MTRARLASSLLCVLALGAGTAANLAAGSERADQPATTDKLLVSVSAAPVPPPASETGASSSQLAERRSERLRNAGGLIARVVARNGLEVERSVPEIGLIVVDPDGAGRAALSRRLEHDPGVTSVRPEPRAELRFTPNDFAFNHHDPNAPGGDFALWPLRRYNAEAAWGLSKGAGARVAVIDTGVSVTHPDLSGNLVGQLDCSEVVAYPADSCVPGGDVSDPVGHGTHVAGLACGDTNDGVGIASLGFHCGLDAIRLDPEFGYGSIASAIVAATDRGADAINMSFGGGSSDPDLIDALEYAWDAGAVPVAAGANDTKGDLSYPAQWVQQQGSGPTIDAGRGLVVTMAKYDGTRNSRAQRNSGVSVAAFGSATNKLSGGQQGILSTWPPSAPPVEDDAISPSVRTAVDGDSDYAYLVGTSMATPQVSGLVALIRAARPTISNEKLIRLVKLTADGGGEYGRGLGWGIIDARAALAAALGRDITAPRSRVRSARFALTVGGRAQITLRLRRHDPVVAGMPTSGVRNVTVYVSVDGGPFGRLRTTTRKRIHFLGRSGRRYRFFTRALDRAGNREARPARADTALSPG